jgi:phosphonate transport system ATP-binding protein
LNWGDRIIGLRAGRVVLDSPVAALDHDNAMSLYTKVDPGPLLAASVPA